MAKKNVIVLAESDDAGSVRRLKAAVEETGLKVESCFIEIGTIIGSIEENRIADLRRLKGVANVSEEDTVQLPSPDDGKPV